MKKLLSLALALVLILSAVAVSPLTAAAAETFVAGDVIYLKIENPADWADNATLYVNFTDASRAEYGRSIPFIDNGQPDRYHPVTGVTRVESGLYRYTVTAQDAGATAMRFWRGNNEKLWNESVTLTAADLAEGNNTAVVTDWSDAGYLTFRNSMDLGAELQLSATKGEVGDSFDIRVTYSVPDSANISCEILINDQKVADGDTYTFKPDADGAYTVTANVVATYFADGSLMYKKSLQNSIVIGTTPVTVEKSNVLYAHAARGSKEMEAWVAWYNVDGTYYFFLPSSISEGDVVELYSSYADAATIGDVKIGSHGVADLVADPQKTYTFTCGSVSRSVRFMFSSAESALFVNNTEDYSGMDFFSYLKENKSNSVAATGAFATGNNTVSDVEIKKMKGRGNTSWNADKKGFNITFKDNVSIAGMDKGKKYSLISNFQDAAMARNRILFDLADQIGVPYSSDSRFVDLYTNGVYQGTYQLCQKIEVGKNTLVSDFEEDDYLDTATGGVKDDFSFVAEIDSSPAEDDFHFTVQNGNNLTMKAPELEANDPNISKVRGYIKNKYNAMYSKLEANASDLNDYIDVVSLAKVYLINELGKNWDSGASSFYLTYKQDANGKYKFFASPVWDYDNSLGNAKGVENDLRRMNCTDYLLPSGWFSTIKGGYNGPNFLATAAKSSKVMQAAYTTWFEDFLPALDILTSQGVSSGEIYSSDVYADILRDTAAMNYHVWPLETNSSWIADHSSVRRYRAEYTRNTYGQVTGVTLSQDRSATNYDQYTFDGQLDYMMDWTTSRAAWISAQYISSYTPSEPPTQPPTEAPTQAPTDVSTEAPTTAPTEPPTEPREIIPDPDLSNAIAAWIFDATDKVEGEKLTEYGSGDDGYAATTGSGTMTLSVDGENGRALEWSAAEYGVTGTAIVPIMAAGSKNLWGSPYIDFTVSTKGYQHIQFTAYLAGSNKAPASWKLQYSTDGESYTDISDAVATITQVSRKLLTAYLDRFSLPTEAADQDTLILRLVPVSMDTVSGGNTADKPSGGEIAINYVVIEGIPAGAETYRRGDADSDDEVSIFDVTSIQRSIAKYTMPASFNDKAADVDGDNEVTIFDATLIQRYIAKFTDPYHINSIVAV